jgi:NAD(P)-dependent dehydrogenase (short-subunit alcohol dehydrogenase family)
MRQPAGVERLTCLVTGGTSGIGRAAARALATSGMTVTIVARDAASGQATVNEIRAVSGSDQVESLVADLSSQASIRAVTETFRQRHDRLDVLVNCAGAFFRQRNVTVDGLEMTFALNHLAYFLLTNLLIDLLRRGPSARILNVTAPASTKINFDDLQGERSYRPMRAFGASKMANLLFTFELARRLAESGITVNAVHPGRVRSGIMREAPAPFRVLTRVLSGSPERAGTAIADLATAPEFADETGRFYRRRHQINANAYARDPSIQRRLWRVSEELTGLAHAS